MRAGYLSGCRVAARGHAGCPYCTGGGPSSGRCWRGSQGRRCGSGVQATAPNRANAVPRGPPPLRAPCPLHRSQPQRPRGPGQPPRGGFSVSEGGLLSEEGGPARCSDGGPEGARREPGSGALPYCTEPPGAAPSLISGGCLLQMAGRPSSRALAPPQKGPGPRSPAHLVVHRGPRAGQPRAHDVGPRQHKLDRARVRPQLGHHVWVLVQHPHGGEPVALPLGEEHRRAVDDGDLHVAGAGAGGGGGGKGAGRRRGREGWGGVRGCGRLGRFRRGGFSEGGFAGTGPAGGRFFLAGGRSLLG